MLSVAVVVRSAAQAAAAMQRLADAFMYPAGITVDPVSGSVSFEMHRRCIIFSVWGEHPILFVKVKGLPPSFIEVQQAQQVLQLPTAAAYMHFFQPTVTPRSLLRLMRLRRRQHLLLRRHRRQKL